MVTVNMTYNINRHTIEEGLLLCGINPHTTEAALIRAGVHSMFNHNAMTAIKDGVMGIVEAVTPISKFTTLEEYEDLMNGGYIVRFYRIKKLSIAERTYAAQYFVDKLLDLPYPKKTKMILLVLPILNAIIDRTEWMPNIRLTWCSQLCKIAYLKALENCLDGLNHKKKKLFTPRTFEKRILLGLFEDVTDEMVICS